LRHRFTGDDRKVIAHSTHAAIGDFNQLFQQVVGDLDPLALLRCKLTRIRVAETKRSGV
jgi:hypothetical protein